MKELVITIILSFCAVIKAINVQNFFPEFRCTSNKFCTINSISSTNELQQIYNLLETKPFEYGLNDNYNCRYHGRQYCHVQRENFDFYTEIEFQNSKFSKFPSGDYQNLNKIKKLKAASVELTEINRDDLKSFKSLEDLDLSSNKISTLSNLFLLHLESLKSLNLKNNQIIEIESLAFDESGPNLIFLDLSFNNLTGINVNLLDVMGKNENVELFLNSNAIEQIESSTSAIYSLKTFKKLNLSKNKLKEFIYNCSSINTLVMSENQLETFEIRNCFVHFLNLSNNNLGSLKVLNVSTLIISNNSNLKELNINFENLEAIDMKNLSPRLITYDDLQNATKLEEFYAANTFMGPLKIDTFSEMSFLKHLDLSHTGLSHIEYGMFSHQKSMISLDISGNGITELDINMLASMQKLETFALDGNNLTRLDHAESIKNIFPSLQKIRIDGNSWNCSYLAGLIKILSEKSIEVVQPQNVVKNSPNVLGMGCVTSAQNKIQTISNDEVNEVISNKLNEVITQINEDKTKRDNHKYDLDVIKTEIFSIQKEMIMMKEKLLKIQLSNGIGMKNNESSSLNMSEVKNMIEEMNNLTLEKQKIAHDNLINKFNELVLEHKVLGVEVDRLKGNYPKTIPTIEKKEPNYQQLQFPVHNENENNVKTVEVLLIILITSLTIVAIFYGYVKLKQTLRNQNNSMSVRARSTNTINTTIEMPFSDGNQ